MKPLAKKAVAWVLGYQVRKLHKKNNFKIIAVTGSVGKTGTKLAIANVLGTKFKVQHQEGNYNHIVTAPLVFFSEKTPSLFNPVAWLGVFWRNHKKLKQNYPYDVVVLELGTDGPGQIKKFKKYLKVDIAVITAVTPEHMEFFADLQAVAAEEFTVSEFSDKVFANKDLSPGEYIKNTGTYGVKQAADYQLTGLRFDGDGANFTIMKDGSKLLDASHEQIAEPQLYAVCAAAAVSSELGLSPQDITKGISQIKPVNGRLNRLAGVNGSTIIDDTYNASPEAMRAALDMLYRLDSPQKIAVLGNMNELGKFSEEEHRKIGEYCDPKQLSLLITIGPDANEYLAPAAEAKGCKVVTFDNPYTIGDYLKPIIKPGALVLVKGSQNGVFAEEAVKLILADPKDQAKLVRQTAEWLRIKERAFKK